MFQSIIEFVKNNALISLVKCGVTQLNLLTLVRVKVKQNVAMF